MNSLCLSYTYANSFPTHAHIQVSGGKTGNVQSAMHMNFLFRGEKIFPIGTKSHPLSTPPSPVSDTDFKGGVEPIICESYRRKICNLPVVVRERGRKAGREGKGLNWQT